MSISINTSPLVASDYVPMDQRDQADPARFKLRPLTERQWLQVMFMHGIGEGGEVKLTPLQVESALEHGLLGWDGITDQDGKPVKFSRMNAERLPAGLRVELAGEIINRSQLGEDGAKNS